MGNLRGEEDMKLNSPPHAVSSPKREDSITASKRREQASEIQPGALLLAGFARSGAFDFAEN